MPLPAAAFPRSSPCIPALTASTSPCPPLVQPRMPSHSRRGSPRLTTATPRPFSAMPLTARLRWALQAVAPGVGAQPNRWAALTCSTPRSTLSQDQAQRTADFNHFVSGGGRALLRRAVHRCASLGTDAAGELDAHRAGRCQCPPGHLACRYCLIPRAWPPATTLNTCERRAGAETRRVQWGGQRPRGVPQPALPCLATQHAFPPLARWLPSTRPQRPVP